MRMDYANTVFLYYFDALAVITIAGWASEPVMA